MAPSRTAVIAVVSVGFMVSGLSAGLTPAAAVPGAAEIHVAPAGSDGSGDGTVANPYATAKRACDDVVPGTTEAIVFADGTHRDSDFGDPDPDAPGVPVEIDCSGSPDVPLAIRPAPGADPVIEFDGFFGVRLRGNHLVFSGFEVAGPAAGISYEQAIGDWWTGTKRFNGNGVVVDGRGVTVRDNYIHHAAGGGINTTADADGVRIIDNVVTDNSWWSTKGTTGIGFVSIDDADEAAAEGLPRIEMSGNVVLRSESRIISHVFKKGFVTMEVDEGSSALIKADGDPENPEAQQGTYSRGYDVRDNLFAHNGKGVSLRGFDIDFRNNTMAGNGTTMAGGGAGIRANEAVELELTDNAVAAAPGKNAVDFNNSDDLFAGDGACIDNLFSGGARFPKDCADGLGGNTFVDRPFTDAEGGDFRIATDRHPAYAGAGVDPAALADMAARLGSWGVDTDPTEYCVDVDRMLDDIIAGAPGDATFDYVSQAPDIVVDFPDTTNPTGERKLDLRFRTEEGPDLVQLCGLVQDRVYEGTISGIEVSAFDAEVEIETAELLIDGEVVATDSSRPFVFDLSTPDGEVGAWDVSSRVTDAEDATKETAPIRIGYDNRVVTTTEDPPPSTKRDPRLRATSLFRAQKDRLVVRGSVRPAAGGFVRMLLKGFDGRKKRVRILTTRVGPRGQVRLTRSLPPRVARWVRDYRRVNLVVKYKGDRAHRRSTVRGPVVR